MPFFGLVIVSLFACCEGDAKGEAAEQNHDNQANLAWIHGVPGENRKRGEEGERDQLTLCS
jgi:hypothetical protein